MSQTFEQTWAPQVVSTNVLCGLQRLSHGHYLISISLWYEPFRGALLHWLPSGITHFCSRLLV